jgi:hypothetical protein
MPRFLLVRTRNGSVFTRAVVAGIADTVDVATVPEVTRK